MAKETALTRKETDAAMSQMMGTTNDRPPEDLASAPMAPVFAALKEGQWIAGIFEGMGPPNEYTPKGGTPVIRETAIIRSRQKNVKVLLNCPLNMKGQLTNVPPGAEVLITRIDDGETAAGFPVGRYLVNSPSLR